MRHFDYPCRDCDEKVNRGNKVENFEVSERRKPMSSIYMVIRIPHL